MFRGTRSPTDLVSVTERKDLLRVVFRAPVQISEYGESYIVCFLQMSDVGLTTYYSHHEVRTRTTERGPFEQETKMCLHLDPILHAQLEVCVMQEFWTTFHRTTKALPENHFGIGIDKPGAGVIDE